MYIERLDKKKKLVIITHDYVPFNSEVKFVEKIVPYYDRFDLNDEEKRKIIDQATNLWIRLMDEYVAINGDKGSCLIGNGIAINYLPKRCRNVIDKIIIYPHKYQGSCTIESSVEKVIEFLKQNGITARYKCGRMD